MRVGVKVLLRRTGMQLKDMPKSLPALRFSQSECKLQLRMTYDLRIIIHAVDGTHEDRTSILTLSLNHR